MSRPTPHGTHRPRSQQGFTLLEVMIAMVVLMAAALAVSGLQTTTTRANMAARNRAIAMEYLQTWTERLKMDAMAWQPGIAAPSLLVNNTGGVWFTPTTAQLGTLGQVSADFWGVDNAVDDDMRYCVNLRATPLRINNTVRADVRVWWYREGGSSPITADTMVDVPGASVQVHGAIESQLNLVDGCGTAANAPINDPRVYTASLSTILTAGSQ